VTLSASSLTGGGGGHRQALAKVSITMPDGLCVVSDGELARRTLREQAPPFPQHDRADEQPIFVDQPFARSVSLSCPLP